MPIDTSPDPASCTTPAAVVSTPAAAAQPVRAAVALAALGVVFGDIGTSPIYAFRESLHAAGPSNPEGTIFGVLSLVFWAVTLVVALKYVVVVMRADNDGEGGTMALLSLAIPVAGRLRTPLIFVGLTGAALFFGDAMITPAISVLSAVEGLGLVAPATKPYIVPIAALVLVALFAIQSRGSGKVGKLFGPVMLAWFLVLGISGIVRIFSHPDILAALDPRYAIAYVAHADGWVAFTVLGSVFLAVTGGEALYADMGHFGRRAIRIDWFLVTMPALILNYLGQGALVLSDPRAASNPFFLMFEGHFLAPVVLLSTAATVIASQAVISGAFALAQQAIQLGVLPRLQVHQTSDVTAGQVFVPQVNWLLAIAVMGLVFGFGSSNALANAYGIAVAGDMLVTTLLVATVARGVWGWPWKVIVPALVLFLVIDLTFVSSNVHKIPDGGWFPLLAGTILLTLMLCWRRGQKAAALRSAANSVPLDGFLTSLAAPDAPLRVPGTAIYLTQSESHVPEALSLNLKHNGIVHREVVLLTVLTERTPRVPDRSRLTVTKLPCGFARVEIRFGFAEKPHVPDALARHRSLFDFDATTASYFLGRKTPVPSSQPDLPWGVEHVYAFLAHNASRAPDYFCIPPEQVVELGTRVEM